MQGTQTDPSTALQFVCIVAVQNIVQHNAAIGHGITGQLRIMPEASRNQEFQHANSKISGNAGFQLSNTQGQACQPHLHRLYSEILGNAGSY